MKFLSRKLIVIVILLILSFVFHYEVINKFPSNTHAWAQSDRYAITQGFVRNNLNLFKPESYVLNHQFPGNWSVPKKESITSVDFPIHDYVPAVIIKATGINQPWISRLYNLLYSLVGFFALYKLCFLLLKNQVKSLFIVIFATTSPVLIFYQSSFIPTIPSLANAIIGVYFYFLFFDSNRKKYFYFAILFLTLAALSRTTFLIPLVAVWSYQALLILKKRTRFQYNILPFFISSLIIISYTLYNSYLRNEFGSLFLNNLIPSDSLTEFFSKLAETWGNWSTSYFSLFHYGAFLILLLVALYFKIKSRKNLSKNQPSFGLFISILFFGNTLFLIAMTYQFAVHDYYFLDSFYLPCILLIIYLIEKIPTNRISNLASYLFLISVGIVFVYNGINFQKERHTYGFWDKTKDTYTHYLEAESLLDKLGIDESKKILLIQPYAPNFPLTLMNRKGYSTMAAHKERIEPTLDWDYDYLIIQNEFFLTEVYPNYPELINKFKKIYDNGKISICVKSGNSQSLSDFLGFEKLTPVLNYYIDFESNYIEKWDNINLDTTIGFASKTSTKLKAQMEYGLAITDTSLDFSKKESVLHISGQLYNENIEGCALIISINADGENKFYKTLEFAKLSTIKNEWEAFNFIINLPKISQDKSELKLYLHHGGKSDFNLDNCLIQVFQDSLYF